jgi:hypothetical protein
MKQLSILFILFVLVSSCKKEAVTPTPSAPTKKELVSKIWKTKEVYLNGQLATDPYWSSWRYEIKQNGTFTSTTNIGTTSGTWAFNSDETKIIFNNSNAGEDNWDILVLDASQFKVKYNDDGAAAEILWQPN